MRKIRIYLVIFILFLLTGQNFGQSTKQSELNIRMNYNVNLFHFVDYLSQWSKYTGKDAEKLYEKYFELTEKDKEMRTKYSTLRAKFGWASEIHLFNWAYNGFKIDTLKKLESIIKYFENRIDNNQSLKKILTDEYSKLSLLEPQIRQYSSILEKSFLSMNKYLTIWSANEDFAKYPIYICFSHSNNNSHGGANGEGVFSEFITKQGEDGIVDGFSIITHELIHKVINLENFLFDFINNDSCYTKETSTFLKQNNLTKAKLIEVFKSADTLGFGNHEASVFEEINVYFLESVIIGKMTDEQINKQIVTYRNEGEIEFERVWYGVQLFKKEYEQIDNPNFDKNQFIWRLIELFYKKVYFKNYNLNNE